MSIRTIGLMSIGFLVATATQAAPKFHVVELPLLPGGTYSSGAAINNAGQVAGSGDDIYGDSEAILWDHGIATNIYNMGDPHGFLASSSAVAINSTGVVVGDFNEEGFPGVFGVGPGVSTSFLSDLFPSMGTISDSNYILGTLRGHPYVWPGVIDFDTGTSLPTTPDNFGAATSLNGINSANVIVGAQYDYDANSSLFPIALRWTPGPDTGAGPDWLGSAIEVLGGLGGPQSWAAAINNCGTTVGWAQLTNTWEHAVLWQAHKTSVHDLGTLGGQNSSAAAINLSNHVVGQAQMPNGEWRAVLWPRTLLWPYEYSHAIDLNHEIDEKWQKRITLTSAAGINDHCMIVANGTDKRTGNAATFLLSPADEGFCHSEHDRRTRDRDDGKASDAGDRNEHRTCEPQDHREPF
jgi:probable HAF family extracellular repeat protein